MNMTWQYIAGFIDGEGSIVKKKLGYAITLPQTNLEVLEKIRDFSTVGNIFKEGERKKHWKENWVFQISNQKDSLFFLQAIVPYLIVKRGSAKEAIPILKNRLLEREINKKLLQKLIMKGKLLRKKGLTYRQIGAKLGIDYGYARRLILSSSNN